MPAQAEIDSGRIPAALRVAFVVHCVVDVVFALPLMFVPVPFLTWLGWPAVDPITTRLVAAALLGIGVESWLGRHAGPASYRGMLNLKIIWSAGAVAGLIASLVGLGKEAPLIGWSLVVIFAVFNGLWIFWRLRLPRAAKGAA